MDGGGKIVDSTPCTRARTIGPDNTLHWLVDVLQAAEDAGERVLLIRHVPNASRSGEARPLGLPCPRPLTPAPPPTRPARPTEHRCNAAWSLNFHKIATRYESTIVAMFTGHFHSDQFEIFYRDDVERTGAAVVNYVGPSATPLTDVNPGFRLYEVREGAD